MSLWLCDACTTSYAVGLAACPHCGSTEHHEEGEIEMPKITRLGGATNAADRPLHLVGERGPEVVALPAGAVVELVGDGTGQALPVADPDGTTVLHWHPDYEQMDVKTLRGYLADRGLPTTGRKAELVARLRASDAADDAEGGQ